MSKKESELGPESRIGWNWTFVFAGEVVRVRKPGFGRGCKATVTRLGEPGAGGICEIQIDQIGRNAAGWKNGNRVDIASYWLEPAKF